MTTVEQYEKLGVFYLGKEHDLKSGETSDDLVLYDSRDLTTHGVCVGMTGSGKTGLCVSLLEEAAMDGIPVLAIDPKGDLANMALTFPELAPNDFEPWIDEGEARRKGRSVSEHAEAVSATWRSGLESWGQDGARIRRLKEQCDVQIYTPGSDSGVQLAVLRSLTAPNDAILADLEAFQDRVEAAVSGLLTLLDVDADPMGSREHVLVSALVTRAWRSGQDLTLADLIRLVQNPGMDTIGVMQVDSFFPAKDRFSLAMRMNAVLASPSFEVWTQGAPLDIPSLLYTETGKPRVAVISIAHLSDAERMFFLSILLNEFLAWVRQQPGTSSLRAMLYMDEIYGYFPPTANPPTKKPMLTLLKQGRAFGVGVMLATQNPVDLDYKGLANIGTWFIGRLQTERDKMRVLEGLEGASAGSGQPFDRGAMEETLAGLGSRVFLLHNAHEDAPVTFHTRWAMSYLRGPMTRDQLRALRADEVVSTPVQSRSVAAATASSTTRVNPRPVLPPNVPEGFQCAVERAQSQVLYRPTVMAPTRLHYVLAKAGLDEWILRDRVVALPDDGVLNWAQAVRYPDGGVEFDEEPIPDASFDTLAADASKASARRSWKAQLKRQLYQDETVDVWYCRSLKIGSRMGQSEAEFRAQLRHAANEVRDDALEKLRDKYAAKMDRVEERIRKAEQRIEREAEQYSSAKVSVAVSIGASLIGALFGRRSAVTKAGSAIRGVGRSSKQRGDVVRAKADLSQRREDLMELDIELQHEVEDLEDQYDPLTIEIEKLTIRPRKADITVGDLRILWQPYASPEDAGLQPLFPHPNQ